MIEVPGLPGNLHPANLHGVISHKTVTYTTTAVRISELTLKPLITLFSVEFLCAGLDDPGVEARPMSFFPSILKRPDRLFGAHTASC